MILLLKAGNNVGICHYEFNILIQYSWVAILK